MEESFFPEIERKLIGCKQSKEKQKNQNIQDHTTPNRSKQQTHTTVTLINLPNYLEKIRKYICRDDNVLFYTKFSYNIEIQFVWLFILYNVLSFAQIVYAAMAEYYRRNLDRPLAGQLTK